MQVGGASMTRIDNDEVVAFLPCRAGSQRVPEKNTREFGKTGKSLFQIKIDQLIECPEIDRIVVSTNDPIIMDWTLRAKARSGGRVELDVRPDHLCSSQTSTDELIAYIPEIISSGHVLWTHVTSPLVHAGEYGKIITTYFDKLRNGGFHSLMTVTKIQSFIWGKSGPINYDRKVEKWPRTQTLEPVYEVNSAVFMVGAKAIADGRDRITDDVYLYELNKLMCVDVDHMEEFHLAARMYESMIADRDGFLKMGNG
jgi:CMP-N-acetylneuraminic acid synthetase